MREINVGKVALFLLITPEAKLFSIGNRLTLDIQLPRLSYQEIAVSTTSGDVSLHQLQGQLLNIETVSGDVDLDLPENAEFTLEARSISGEVSCALPITIEDMANKGHLHGKVNGGGVLFDLNTTSGDVRIF